MSFYHWLKRIFDFFNYIIALIGGLVILFIGIILTIEVVLRLLGHPTDWIQESSIYLFAGAMMCGMAYTLKQEKHIHVELLLSNLPSQIKIILNIVTSVVGAFFCGIVTNDALFHLLDVYSISESTATSLRIPLVIKDFPVFLGFLLLTIQFIFIAIDKMLHLLTFGRQQNNDLGTNHFSVQSKTSTQKGGNL